MGKPTKTRTWQDWAGIRKGKRGTRFGDWVKRTHPDAVYIGRQSWSHRTNDVQTWLVPSLGGGMTHVTAGFGGGGRNGYCTPRYGCAAYGESYTFH